MDKKQTEERVLPSEIEIWNWAIFVVPCVTTMFFCTYKRLGLSFSDAPKVYLSLPVILYLICVILIVFFVQKKCYGDIKAFDGSDESYAKANLAYKVLSFFNLLFPVAGSFIYPSFASLGGGELIWSYWGVMYSSVLSGTLVATLFYNIWFVKFSSWLKFIPMRDKNITFGIGFRLLLTLFIAIWGIFSGVMCTLLISRRVADFSDGDAYATVFVLNWIPHMIFSMGFTLVDVGFVVHSIKKQLKSIVSVTSSLAEGNYNIDYLPILTRDEMGYVVMNINEFYASTKGLLLGVRSNVETSVNLTQELNASMEQSSCSIEEIVNNIDSLEVQMKEQSSIIDTTSLVAQKIVERIKSLDSSIENQSAGVEESSAAVKQMVANIESVNKILVKNSEQAKKLDEVSKEGQRRVEDAASYAQQIMDESHSLMEASTVVRNIAKQTNMLAMNASIEAAHAGKMGAGFSVVADEIRKLAEQSNEQGKKITESLKSLQRIIQGVSDSTLAVQSQFKDIYEMTNLVTQQEGVVLNAMQEQTEGSKQILLAMKNIDESTYTVRNESKEMLSGGTVIVSHMDKLNGSSSLMKKSITDISSDSDQILDAIKHVKNNAVQSNDAVESLNVEMSKFKLN